MKINQVNHTWFSDNILRCDSDSYKKKDFGFTHMKLETINF